MAVAADYALRRGEPLAMALRRLAAAQTARSTATLLDKSLPFPERVHESRKRFKETRALLRLFRLPLGDLFQPANRCYRDAGRTLQTYRDATTVVEAVDGLARGVRSDIGLVALEKLRAVAHDRHEALYAHGDDLRERIDRVVAALKDAQARIENAPIVDGAHFAILEPGFVRTVDDGRRAMREAYAYRDDAAFHEWRKRVKDHWHQVQLLLPVRPKFLDKREKELHELARVLGEHHDLWLVGQLVRDAGPLVGGPNEADRINDALVERRKKLAERARPIGKRLYASAPREIGGDVAALWNAWYST